MQRALALNDSWFWVHIFLGYISLYQQQYEQALAEMERTVALAPTVAESYAALAEVLSRMGRTEERPGGCNTSAAPEDTNSRTIT